MGRNKEATPDVQHEYLFYSHFLTLLEDMVFPFHLFYPFIYRTCRRILPALIAHSTDFYTK
jgi:hypothetical protein